jgi:hypothetical protein
MARRWAIGAAHVIAIPVGAVDHPGCGRYMPCPIGDFAFLFACQTTHGVADLAAWVPSSGRIMTRLGVAGMLGQRQAEEAHHDITARPMRVWRDPLGWLRAGRSGCVVVDQIMAAHILGGLPIGAEDERHAHELRALRVAAPRARVHADWCLVG